MEETMTAAEVCAELHISRKTLYNRIKAERLTPLPKQNPALDIEPLRFLREDVERLKRPATETCKPSD
jgi:predicted DNA-binding transcriptional regulator AlpA